MKPKPRTATTPDVRVYALCVLLAVAVLAVYCRAGGYGFTLFDDNDYVTENPRVVAGLSLDNVRWAFTTYHASNWHPLTWASLMTDASLTKPHDPRSHAAVFHWTSILLHAANSVLLLLLLYSATGSLWRGAFVAALFALHPLHVESVAWVTERKDVLSTLFWLLAAWAYVSWARAAMHRKAVCADARPRVLLYVTSLICLALGLMAKPMLVTLPLTLILLDFWPLKRFGTVPARRLVVEKLPMFALVAGSCALTYLAQKAGGSVSPLEACPFGPRMAAVFVAYPSYLIKMIYPVGLAAFYPHPGFGIPQWQVIAGAAFLVIATGASLRLARQLPYLTFGWLWFVITLLPVIGLMQVGKQSIADRYTYVTLIGIFVIIAWGVPELAARFAKRPAYVLGAAAAVAIAAMIPLTWVQVGSWRDDTTLFAHAIAVTKDNYLAHSMLGCVFQAKNDYPAAEEHFRKSVEINYNFGNAHYNLGLVLQRRGEIAGAAEQFRAALETSVPKPEIYTNLACALADLGQTEEADRRFREAIDRFPSFVEAHNNFAIFLAKRGRLDEAVDQLRIAHDLDPNNPSIRANLQQALSLKGR